MNQYQMREIEMAQKDPSGFAEYMATYGGHFSKKMCEWAVSMMRGENGKKISPYDKDTVEAILTNNGVALKNDKGYDKVYVANMCLADFYGKSVTDEKHLAMYVKDLLDDPDGYDELVFNRFMMDCMGREIPIMWEDML